MNVYRVRIRVQHTFFSLFFFIVSVAHWIQFSSVYVRFTSFLLFHSNTLFFGHNPQVSWFLCSIFLFYFVSYISFLFIFFFIVMLWKQIKRKSKSSHDNRTDRNITISIRRCTVWIRNSSSCESWKKHIGKCEWSIWSYVRLSTCRRRIVVAPWWWCYVKFSVCNWMVYITNSQNRKSNKFIIQCLQQFFVFFSFIRSLFVIIFQYFLRFLLCIHLLLIGWNNGHKKIVCVYVNVIIE